MVHYNKTCHQTCVHLQAHINVICGAQKQITPTFKQGKDEFCFYIDLNGLVCYIRWLKNDVRANIFLLNKFCPVTSMRGQCSAGQRLYGTNKLKLRRKNLLVLHSRSSQQSSFHLDQVWSILPALELLPFDCSHWREQSSESNSNAGKMDQTWSSFYPFVFTLNSFVFSWKCKTPNLLWRENIGIETLWSWVGSNLHKLPKFGSTCGLVLIISNFRANHSNVSRGLWLIHTLVTS